MPGSPVSDRPVSDRPGISRPSGSSAAPQDGPSPVGHSPGAVAGPVLPAVPATGPAPEPAPDPELPLRGSLDCFKAYDIRGRLGRELDPARARRIGRAFARALPPAEGGRVRVVVGGDCRLSTPALRAALARGLCEAGAEVVDIGLCGTEEIYFATGYLCCSGGIAVTASHNPADYNGMKLVGPGARPLTQAEFDGLRAAAEAGVAAAPVPGSLSQADPRAAYVDRILSFTDPTGLGPLRILVDAGNGAAGPTFDALARALADRGARLHFERFRHAPDGHFPHGVPNPLLPENRPATAAALRAAGADFAVAWDGDFDRCFFFDETGAFVDGYYIVGLLAEEALRRAPGGTIVHDPRMSWNTLDIVARAGGRAVAAPTGHAFLKAAMRAEAAVYGGELSAHHYFRDFMCCDSGMIPWLLVAGLVSRQGKPLSALVAARRALFPGSGERNYTCPEPEAAMARVQAHFAAEAAQTDLLDGLGMSFADWRFNLRCSRTEPLLRLNVEIRGSGDAGADTARIAVLTARLEALF